MNVVKIMMTILFPLITFPYASRILLADGIGKANYVASVVSYFQLLSSLGISAYAITEGAKIRNDQKKLNHFATEILAINLISTLISYLLFFIVISMPTFVNYKYLLLISSISIIFTTIGVEWLYNVLEEYKYITIRSIMFQLLSLILLFIFVRDKNDVPQYVALTAISAAGSGILNFLHRRKFIKLFSDPLGSYNLRRHLKPILIIFGMSVASTIYLNADITILGIMKDDTTVGIYTAAVKLNKAVCLLIGSLSTVLLPRLSYYITLDDKSKFNNLVKKAINFMLALIVPSMLGMFLLGKELILMLSGSGFLDAVPTTKIMTFNLLLSPLNGFLAYQIFMPFRKEKISFYATLAGSIGNMVLNFLLIPKFSHEGAAIATIIAEGIVTLFCIYYAKELVNIKDIIKGTWQYVVASLSIILVYYVVGICGVTNIILRVILITLFGAIAYTLALLAMNNTFLIDILKQVKVKFKK